MSKSGAAAAREAQGVLGLLMAALVFLHIAAALGHLWSAATMRWFAWRRG